MGRRGNFRLRLAVGRFRQFVNRCRLVPGTHQIYICAAGCLRGVILTAAEMGDSYRRRFHTLELRERDLYATDQETFLIEGISDILRRLDTLPPAVLVFTACVHHFLGCNLTYVYRTLRHRFPSVQFAECIMDPIRQTKAMPPETRERLEIYRLLKKTNARDNAINLIGSNLALDENSDIKELLNPLWANSRASESKASNSFECSAECSRESTQLKLVCEYRTAGLPVGAPF